MTALRGRDPDRVWRAAVWLARVGEFRFDDALMVCEFLARHEPTSDRASRARARLVARLAMELKVGLDHLDQLQTWAEILPDPVAVAGLGRLCREVDSAHVRARADSGAVPSVRPRRR